MKTLFLTSLIILVSTQVKAWDDEREYLQVGPGFTEEIYGDGYEAGFEFSVTFNSHDAQVQPPVILIENDSAECDPSDFTLKAKTPSFKLPSGIQYYNYTFSASVGTSVLGDSGGCIAIIKANEPNNSEILKIVFYGYTTDYYKLVMLKNLK